MTISLLSHDQRGVVEEEEDEPQDLLAKPREYKVKFSFPNPPPLNPPILGAYGECVRGRGGLGAGAGMLGREGRERVCLCIMCVCRCDFCLPWDASTF